MFEGLTLMKALGFLGKRWPYILIAILTASLLLSRHDLGNARAKIADELQFRQAIASVLQSEKSDGPVLLAVADARMRTIINQRNTLQTISDQALQNKQRADAADAQLKTAQTENNKRFAAAQAQITQLQSHKTTGNRDADFNQIDEDSKAAWKGWK